MSDLEFESMIKNALDQHVDAHLGARRPAPPFVPTADAGRTGGTPRPPRWLYPLLAAAAVVVMALGVAFAGGAFKTHSAPPPATQIPTSSDVPTAPPSTPVPSSGAPTTAVTSSSAPPATTVTFGAARIAIPKGWVTRKMSAGTESLCVAPFGKLDDTCQQGVQLFSAPTGVGLDPSNDWGVSGDPPQCYHKGTKHRQTATKQFGGQDAQWLRTTGTECGFDLERYLVGSVFDAVTDSVDPSVHDGLHYMAEHSTLTGGTGTAQQTLEQTVRPVAADGRPAAGWRIVPAIGSAPGCHPVDQPAQSAVDDGIFRCDGDDGSACWPSHTKQMVLCVADVAAKTLTEVLADVPATHPKAPGSRSAVALEVNGHGTCRPWVDMNTRAGWKSLYQCSDGDLLWKQDGGVLLDRNGGYWTVHVAPSDGGQPQTATVSTAYYVGTAPDSGLTGALTPKWSSVYPLFVGGDPAQGVKVVDDNSVTCTPTRDGPYVSIGGGAFQCLPKYVACYPAASSDQALCIGDPNAQKLYRVPVTGTVPDDVQRYDVVPMRMTLSDGAHCLINATPGSSGEVALYTCGSHESVWGTAGTTGLVTGPDGWSVSVGDSGGANRHQVQVTDALYVAMSS